MSDDSGSPNAVGPTPEPIACWRCGQVIVPLQGTCPQCDASLSAAYRVVRRQRTAADDSGSLVVLLVFFGLLLATSVAFGIVHHARGDVAGRRDLAHAGGVLYEILVLEAIDSVLVIAAWIYMPRSPRVRPEASVRLVTWLASPVLLGIALLINFAYHQFLRDVLRLPLIEDLLTAHEELFWLNVIAICIQPAVIEELFFRQLALGTLRAWINVPMTIFISSLMFAMAHLGVPLSMPALFVVGVALGVARVYSGGLLLPMLMHFAHNAVVVWLEMG